MTETSWIHLDHILGIIIAAIPAVIAAVSSLKNGRTLKKNRKILDEAINGKPQAKKPKGKGSQGDWYRAPDLD